MRFLIVDHCEEAKKSDNHAVDHHYEVFPLLEFVVKKETPQYSMPKSKAKMFCPKKGPSKMDIKRHFSFEIRLEFVHIRNVRI